MSVSPPSLDTYRNLSRTLTYPKMSNRINMERVAQIVSDSGIVVNTESDSSKVSGFVWQLALAHERVYALRYREPVVENMVALYTDERGFWNASFASAVLLGDLGLIKSLEFVRYQLCEHNIDALTEKLIALIGTLIGELALNLAHSQLEYQQAAWG